MGSDITVYVLNRTKIELVDRLLCNSNCVFSWKIYTKIIVFKNFLNNYCTISVQILFFRHGNCNVVVVLN
jgi:hypothetical protein